MNNDNYHIPVLLEEVITGLNLKENAVVVDGTLGGAGHSSEILKRFAGVKIIAFDRDLEAIEYSKNKLKAFANQVEYNHTNYKDIPKVLEGLKIKADAILLDLGVSSHQIDNRERGFSFRFDSSLDMRMNSEDDLTAEKIVNEYSEEDLANVIYNYGEERLSRKIANSIVKSRPVKTTFELKNIVEECVSRYNKREVKSSIQRVFQAIRIEVNDELNGLFDLFLSLPKYVNKGGRIAIITFHSLEDRIVKRAFGELSTNCICPPSIPICVCNHKAVAKLVNKKPIIAGDKELECNSRASCAKLRIIEIL